MEILEKAHKYLGVTIDIRRDFIIQARKSTDKGLSFIKQIITVSGIIAGFGFTAIGDIERKCFFITGESVLFLNICLGLYFIKEFWYKDFEMFKSDIKKMQDIADILRSGIEEKNEKKANKGIMELEKFAQQDRDEKKLFKLLPDIMIVLVFVSAVFILLSVTKLEYENKKIDNYQYCPLTLDKFYTKM